MTIQRYDYMEVIQEFGGNYYDYVPYTHGDWVKYEDHQRIVEELEKELQRLAGILDAHDAAMWGGLDC